MSSEKGLYYLGIHCPQAGYTQLQEFCDERLKIAEIAPDARTIDVFPSSQHDARFFVGICSQQKVDELTTFDNGEIDVEILCCAIEDLPEHTVGDLLIPPEIILFSLS